MNQQDALRIENRGEVLSRYKHLRQVSISLNHKLVKTISKEVMHEGGKKLGILQRGTLVFKAEDEMSVLMDYCIYDVRRKGRNAVEQYLLDSPPDPESDEMTCLQAMQRATYSLFVVKSVERGFGVIVQDLRSNEQILIVDVGLGSSAEPGMVLASRLLLFDGFSMTGGAMLPIGVLPPGQEGTMIKKFFEGDALGDDENFDPASLIRTCLGMDCSSNVRYQEPTKQSPQPRSSSSTRSATIGRNDPCPCGSGKKYKKCCLNRR